MAATGKGFAIGGAVLTSPTLLSAFKSKAEVTVVDIGGSVVVVSDVDSVKIFLAVV